MGDQWCEQRMWKSVGLSTECEIFSVISACLFFVWPFYKIPSQIPTELIAMQCCLCHVGIGTIAFHSGLNIPVGGLMDYYPMILTATLLIYMYLSYLAKIKAKFCCVKLLFDSKYSIFIWTMVISSWALFICYGLDSNFQNVLNQSFPGGQYFHWTNVINVVMVLPMIMIFLYFSMYYLPTEYVYRAWIMLAISELFYFINYLACQYSYWLGIFHGLYHMGMCVSIWYVACVGITLNGQWMMEGLFLKQLDFNP